MHKKPILRFIVLGVSVSVAFVSLYSPSKQVAQAQTVVQTNQRWEMSFTSSRTYANPFIDVTITVEYTKQGSPTIRSLAFWDGGNTFKIRMAFPEAGTWTYRTTSSDTANTRLHNQTGTVQVRPYKGSNQLYQHGFLRVSANRRFLEHADGTPFFWLGDTLWGATVWLSENGFHQAIDDLAAKKFTVLQTNFARKSEVDTNGMVPYDTGTRQWNVAFMQKLDREFQYANDQGIVLFVNGLIDLKWDRGIQEWERLVQIIAARYAGNYVTWSSSMDDPYSSEQDQIGQVIDAVTDRHLITQHGGSDSVDSSCPARLHSNVCAAQLYQSKSYIDYTMYAPGGGSQNIIEGIHWLYHFSPIKPIVNGEAGYENLDSTAAETTRMAYFTLLSGACGHTHGTMYWNASDSNILAWASLPGRVSLAYLSTFWRSIDGGRALIPRSDLITNQASSYDEKMLIASTQSGSKYVAYLSVGGTITIDLRSVGGQLAVTWFDPLSGHTVGNTTTSGGAVRSFPSPLGSQPSVLVLSGNTDSQVMGDTSASPQRHCCSTLLPGSPMATGFGTPWNVFNVSELLLKAYSNGLQTTIALGPSTYVYSQGYAWVNNQWQQVVFTCTGGQIVQNVWCPTSAQATLPQNATFVVAYTCNWTGTQWNCGCADTTCRQNFWQLQKID